MHQIKLVTVLIICLLYTFCSKEIPFLNVNYAGTFDVSCGMFSNVITLFLGIVIRNQKISSLIWLSVGDGQKKRGSKDVLLLLIG